MSREVLENQTEPTQSTATRLLMLLKTRGTQTAADLGGALGVTGEAARQQLVKLAAEGLVSAASEARGVGRPVQAWSLTAAGNARFPDAHAEVTVQLIRAVRAQLGEAALDRLIDFRAAESSATYARELEGAAGLEEKVSRLADARTREGYMAEVQPGDGGYLLVENHCPICAAAQACQGFCRAELDTFRKVLGAGVSVERTEHIVAGSRRCAYRIGLEVVPESGRKRGARAAKKGERDQS